MSVLGTIAAVGAAGSIGGAAIGAHAAGKAADAQVNSANYAANLQHKDAQDALAFNEKQYDTNQQNLAPWLSAGKDSLAQLTAMMSNGGFPAFNEQFQAPTAATEQNDPGYQFRLGQGEGAITNSAASRGKLFSGNTQEALTKFAQDYSSNEYSNVYNRALQQFDQRYNIFEGNQANQFNRLAALSGVGQTAANTLGQEGQSAANTNSTILLNSGQQIGNDIQNAGAARASGYVGGANAWTGALGGASSNISNLLMLQQLYGGGGNTINGLTPEQWGQDIPAG